MPIWRFHPGRLQHVADCLSLDVQEHDAIRAEIAGTISEKTLGDIFALVARKRSTTEIDDSDALCFARLSRVNSLHFDADPSEDLLAQYLDISPVLPGASGIFTDARGDHNFFGNYEPRIGGKTLPSFRPG